MQLREIRVEQQLRRVYAYRRLTLAFTAQYPLGVHQAPEIWTYRTQCEHNDRLSVLNCAQNTGGTWRTSKILQQVDLTTDFIAYW